MIDINKEKNRINDTIDTQAYLIKPLYEWRDILNKECQVYVMNEQYIAKRFDQINFKFCSQQQAKEILIDNLYALLRFKYFSQTSDDTEERIDSIVKSFTANLKTTLLKISTLHTGDGRKVSFLPKECIAFKNGVFNFKTNKWLFQYDIIHVEKLHNTLYMYDPSYIILWYFNFNFTPLGFNVMEDKLEDVIEIMKIDTKAKQNSCFELMYNMAHNSVDVFDFERFKHLCQIIGYNLLQDFCEAFVILVGSGGNGKNSLFDGCMIPYIHPRPTSNSLKSIETDRFIGGVFENHAQNIYLESPGKGKATEVYEDSTNLKNLTGSPYQTVEIKGIQKYQSYINCKHTFSINSQQSLKFGDTTPGFRRRINIFEIWFAWDAEGRYLKKGDYYDTTFSEDLHEITDNIENAIMFIYFAMYGIYSATNGFETSFKFTRNDWSLDYTDLDLNLKDRLNAITANQIVDYAKNNPEDFDTAIYDETGKYRLYKSFVFKTYGYKDKSDVIKIFDDDELRAEFFSENDVYISLRAIQIAMKDTRTPTSFTQAVKKLYNINQFQKLYNNKPYIKINFVGKRIRIME